MTTIRKFNMADTIGRYAETAQIVNLIGAKLVSAEKVGDEIVITTDRGTLRGAPEGGCCSISWVDSVDCEAAPGAVFVDRISFDDEGRVCEWANGDENKVYFGTLYTDKGRVMWELRNESNGYYGGWLNWSWEASK